MDSRRFDALARSLAASKTRRGLLGSLAAMGAGLIGAKATGAQVTQVYCGNQFCASNPGSCKPGCVCCVYTNAVTGTVINSRCRPPGTCSPGTVACPPGQVANTAGGCTAPTTTTTTTTTTTVAPCPPETTRCGADCVNTLNDEANCGECGNVCPDAHGVVCAFGACCQLLTGAPATCSATMPCCQGSPSEIRCEDGHCCAGFGFLCLVGGDSCCGQCVPEPGCEEHGCGVGFCV